MAPPRFTNPPPKTESARSAVKAFFCELCQKGYARMNEWEAHEGSYDHQHRKRLKELSRMQRDPNATNKARERERREEEKAGISGLSFKPVKLGTGSGGDASDGNAGLSKGFKKGGFKSAFGGGAPVAVVDVPVDEADERAGKKVGQIDAAVDEVGEVESDSDDGEERYDPRFPTGCSDGCESSLAREKGLPSVGVS